MSLLRAFIAIEIHPDIRKAIADQSDTLQQKIGNGVRWVPVSNIHLTLQFLGETSSKNIEYLSHSLKAEAEQHAPFEISIGHLGSFPDTRRPRIIWLGIQAPNELTRLQHAIGQCIAHLGYTPDKKTFSPHLTIGRVHEQVSSSELQNIRKVLEETKIGKLGSTLIQSIHLFKSELKPTGAIYTRLSTAQLTRTTR